MAEAEAVVEAGGGDSQGPLVQVTFQKNPARKQKYLESEPKALGITQVGLSVFQISSVGMFLGRGLSLLETDVPFLILSVLVIIAGSVAVAAQNLHLPTLKACLGMQIVACIASLVNMIIAVAKLASEPVNCWRYTYYGVNNTNSNIDVCHQAETAISHFYAEVLLIQVALVAISITLAAYCCKVVNCCSPPPKMPVITVQAPPVQQ